MMIRAAAAACLALCWGSAQAASLATVNSLILQPNTPTLTDPVAIQQSFTSQPGSGSAAFGQARADANGVGVLFNGTIGDVAATFEDTVVMYLLPRAPLTGPITISIAGQVKGDIAEQNLDGTQKALGESTLVRVGLDTYSVSGSNPGGVDAARANAIARTQNGFGTFSANTVGSFSTSYSVGGSSQSLTAATVTSASLGLATSATCDQLGLPPDCSGADRLVDISAISGLRSTTFGFGVALGVAQFEGTFAEVDFFNSFDIEGLIATDEDGNILPALFFGTSGREYTVAAFDPLADLGNPIPVPGALFLMAPALIVLRKVRRG